MYFIQTRRILTALALAACTIVPITSKAASIFGKPAASAAATDMPKGKTIKLTLKNRTAAEMTVIVNDKPVIIAANGEYALKTTAGTDVFAADHTTVKLHVTSEMNGNTVSFR